MILPKPHQIEGAVFLAERPRAILADEQRVGKTGAGITACDLAMANPVLVVTTASGRPNWARDIGDWSPYRRSVSVSYGSAPPATADVMIVGWGSVATMADRLRERTWGAIILDELHNAKSPDAARTQAVFSSGWRSTLSWGLTGTPIPNSPADLWPVLDAWAPERIDGAAYEAFCDRYCTSYIRILDRRKPPVFFATVMMAHPYVGADASRGWPDVSTYPLFAARYGMFGTDLSVRRNTAEFIERFRPSREKYRRVFTGGKNMAELNARLEGFWLRRTQQEIGIDKPIYALHSLHVPSLPRELRMLANAQQILDAAEKGDTDSLGLHIGPLRRLTGMLKAGAAAAAVAEELDDGLDKIVLMAWHTDVIDLLKKRLSAYGVVGIDGRTAPDKRGAIVSAFQHGEARVFVGQILAAGEAIDLSAAAELMFVEYSFVPKDMSQAALRITNMEQKRQTRVRVCALAGSFDEAMARILTRKVATIRQLTN